MANSFTLRIDTPQQLAVLKDAFSNVADVEGDQCLDLLSTVRVDMEINDEALSDLVVARSRVVAAKLAVKRLNEVPLNDIPVRFHLGSQEVEVLERGLSFLSDLFGDSVSEPFYKVKFEDTVTFTREQYKLLREQVEEQVDKLLAAKDLLTTVRRYT